MVFHIPYCILSDNSGWNKESTFLGIFLQSGLTFYCEQVYLLQADKNIV